MKPEIVTYLKRILLVIFLMSTVGVGLRWAVHQLGAEDYNDAKQQAGVLDITNNFVTDLAEEKDEPIEVDEYNDPHMVSLMEIDIKALQTVNEEVIGWIEIPGTEVSYPLLQGTDNQHYLEHTWKNEWNSVGSIFMDCQIEPTFCEFNTIVYGHRMRNGSMFGSLKHYEEASYWKEHPNIYVVSDDCVRRYDIYAAFEPGVEDIIFGLGIEEQEIKEEFIRFGIERSLIETGIKPDISDRVLTLSTCTGKGYAARWVVQAVLSEEYDFFKQQE